MGAMAEVKKPNNTIDKLALIVTTYKRQQLLETLFDSILALEQAPWRIVIVDNEQSDQTADMVAAFAGKVTGQWGTTVADQSGNEERVVYAPQTENLGGAGGFSAGVAKAYDFERVNALLAAKADSLEMTENKIVRLVCLWNGEKVDDEQKLVSYPNNFDTRGLYDEFDLAARLMLVDAPDSVRREQMQSVLDKLFPQLPQAKRAEIEKELKDWPPQDVVDPLADPKSLPADAGQAAKQTNTDSAKNISKAV